jgi:alkaline phosphatase
MYRNLNVVLGGGLNQLGVPVKQGNYVFCTRDDKQNLVEKWKQGRKNYLFVNTTRDLMDADLSKVKYSKPTGFSLVNSTEQTCSGLKLLGSVPYASMWSLAFTTTF